MINDKIGAALICCDRPEFYKKSFSSLSKAVRKNNAEYVVINDGKEKLPEYPKNFIETSGKTGVAHAKNLGLKYLLDKDCEHIFLMEEDVEIIDYDVFSFYISVKKSTGICHANYALHGNHNLNPDGTPNIRKTIKYPDGTEIDLYPNLLGAFSYYHRSVLDDVGVMDESFYNAMEHVDHTYEIIKHGYHPKFRWFADVHNSSEYLRDIVPDHQQSVIRNENFQEVFKKGLDRFIEKHAFSVVQGYGPAEHIWTEKECLENLKDIYSRRISS